MSLDLDLSGADAKINRADDHLKELQAEIARTVPARQARAFAGLVGPDGWCTIRLRFNKPKAVWLGVIAGEYVQNLRSALNYIVATLVGATPGLALAKEHEFPIVDDPTRYASEIWRPGEGVGRGVLKGVAYGLSTIEAVQPYHSLPNTTADPLWQLRRFSDTDMQRRIFDVVPSLTGNTQILSTHGRVIEQRRPTNPGGLDAGFELDSLRFAEPYPLDVQLRAEVDMAPVFTAEAFEPRSNRLTLDFLTFAQLSRHVRLIRDSIRSL